MKKIFVMLGALLCAAVAISSCALSNSGSSSKSKLEVTADDLGGYLLVFFRDETHSLYFALSSDGYTFTAVNDGQPVMSGRDLAEQKGVRDPYIGRGPDGFYMAMTDLHISAQREGLRSTQWERGSEYGWGNNRALVLMKSKDLINWSKANYRIDKAFPEEFSEAGCFWAPEIIYDPAVDKMMVYFTLRFRNEDCKIYYAHTDKDFTKFIETPKLIGMNPPVNKSYIDGDITYANGKYYLFVANNNNLKLAVSDKLTENYVYNDTTIVNGEGATEAPNVWKRIGTDKYVLMYDNFTRPNEMAFQETTDFKTFTPLGRFNKGVMKTTNFTGAKHGAVMPLTKAEAKKFAEHWKLEKY